MVKKFVFLTVKPTLSALALATCLGLFGCSSNTNNLCEEETAVAESYLDAVLGAQVINPQAPTDRRPVEGYPGTIAERAYTDYEDGFGHASVEQKEGEQQAADLFSGALSGD